MCTDIIITCEHASNIIPKHYHYLFEKEPEILDTHFAYDIGALAIAKNLKKALSAQLFYSEVSRLLIDTNRSLHHHNSFSRFTKNLSDSEKNIIREKYYHSHIDRIFYEIEQKISKNKKILHLAIHSFTHRLNGKIRNNDIGFLLDPQRTREKKFCLKWKNELKIIQPQIKTRMNYPYRGNSDCLASNLRKKWNDAQYMGIEVELNQKLLLNRNFQIKIYSPLLLSLRSALSFA